MTINRTIRYANMIRDIRQRQIDAERAHASLSRYFSPQLASRLAAGTAPDQMMVHLRDIAVIFTDITGFLSLVEKTDPAALGEMLNEYMFGMTEIVFDHDGTVAKVIGDAIQVLFNAPSDQQDCAARAIACAQDLDSWAEEYRSRWRSRGVNFGSTRIGVHAGPALVGNFGGTRFFDYTAHGDTINTAARLEAANKYLGTRICVSSAAVNGAGNFFGRPIGELMLRGRSEPIVAYEPLAMSKSDPGYHDNYLQAYFKLEKKDPDAVTAFASLVASKADDALARYHLRRLLNGGSGVRISPE